MIRAHIQTDDFVFECDFDAEPWFDRAQSVEIVNLFDVGWANDEAADFVVLNHPKPSDEILAIFKYLAAVNNRRDASGFEVAVDDFDAIRWVAKYRPHLITLSL